LRDPDRPVPNVEPKRAPSSAATSSAAPTTDADDAALVARAKKGDRDAFDRLARRHVPRLVGAARRLLRDASEAEDAAADALMKAYAALSRLEKDTAFGPWIHRVVIRSALDLLRARRRAGRLLDHGPVVRDGDAGESGESGLFELRDPHGRPPDDRAEARDELERVRAAVDALPEAQRVVIVLHAWESLSYRDIAALVGCSYDAVRVNVAHARRTLEARLGLERCRRDGGEGKAS